MKAWVTRRREEGAALSTPLPVIDGAGLCEVLVVEVTELGNRRPRKVARIQPIGQQRILAQLTMPKLVKFVGWTMVLSGIEERKDDYGKLKGTAQTWLCELRPPESAVGFRIAHTYQGGAALPRNGLRDAGTTKGKLVVSNQHSTALQRPTTCAELHHHQIATFPAARLVDCHIEWMSDDGFELGGLTLWEAHRERPERLERDGWLCWFDIKDRELTKSEYRMLR